MSKAMDQKPISLRAESKSPAKSAGLPEDAERINYTLYDIANAVNTTRNLKELYQSIYNSLNKLMPLPNFYIALYDHQKKTIHFEYFIDEYDDDFPIIETLEEPGCLTGEVLLAGRPLFLKENMLMEWARKNKIVGTVPKIWLGVPLIIQGTVIGAICVQHYSDPGYFSHRHLEILISVSDQIAVAIERRQILDALEKKEKTLSLIFDQNPDSILITRMDTGAIADANKVFMDLSGLGPDAVLGKTTEEIGMWKDKYEYPAWIARLKEKGSYKNQKAALFLKNKTILALISSKVLDLDGIPHIISIIRDISDQKIFENGLPQPRMEKTKECSVENSPKTILVIEDEDMVRDMAVKALKVFGYKTLDACDGEAGAALFKKHHTSIDAVLLDIIMPKMSGTETFRQLLKINPNVKVIVASGHVTNDDQKKIFTRACAYLEKPYQIMELKQTLESIFK